MSWTYYIVPTLALLFGIAVVAIALWASSPEGKRYSQELRAWSKWEAYALRYHPAWWDSHCNPTPPRQVFSRTLQEFGKTLRYRQSERYTDQSMFEAFNHILEHRPGLVVDYNAWHAIHTAQEDGLLDENFDPKQLGRTFPDEETTRQLALHRLGETISPGGGNRALAAYLSSTTGL